MRICVIGPGFVGKAAAKMWKAQGHEITVTARSLEKAYALREIADLVYILDDNWHDLLEKQDVVLLSVAPSNQDYLETYLHSAQKLVAGLAHSNVSQILYTGTASVYGEHNGEVVTEETPLKPNTAKSQILVSTEDTLLKAKKPNRKVCLFRLGEIYGEERSLQHKLQKMGNVVLPGKGDQPVNLSHLHEILSALDLAVKEKLTGVYNLCNDMHMTRKELYIQVCLQMGIQPPTWDSTIEASHMHRGRKKLSNEKLKQAGWVPLNQI